MKKALKGLFIQLNFLSTLKKTAQMIQKPLRKQFIHRVASTGYVPSPRNLTFEVTAKCNLRCKKCFLEFKRYIKGTELSTEAVCRMVSRLPDTIRHVSLIGGEPLFRRDLLEICEVFKQKQMRISLTTNGFRGQNLVEMCKKGLVDHVSMSLDGPQKIHEKLRGSESNYNDILFLLKQLKEMRGLSVSITSLLTAELLPSFGIFLDFFKENNINSWSLELERFYTSEVISSSINEMILPENLAHLVVGDNDKYSYELDATFSLLTNLEKRAREKGIQLLFLPKSLMLFFIDWHERALREKYTVYCGHFDDLRLDSRGNVILCHPIHRPFGNILDQSFESIWFGSEMKNFRRRLLQQNLVPVCETCYRCKILGPRLV